MGYLETYKESVGNVINPNSLICGDCLTVMRDIKDKSIDCIITDLPYGRTKNHWDVVLPFDLMWEEYHRVIKDNGAIILFAEGMFMAELMLSNKKYWRYNLVWDKVATTGFLNARRQPLRSHEEMVVFYKKPPTYNPQFKEGKQNHSKGRLDKETTNFNYGEFNLVDNREELGTKKFPKSIWLYPKVPPSKIVHPTEKPIDLIEELILTYTNIGDVVLDSCCGSGTTGVAALQKGRKFICIEKEEKYFNIAKERLEKVSAWVQ